MNAADSLRKGWCPGALRPMRVGDGLLARVKPRGNRLTIAQAQGIAEASRRFGNGVLNITGRANLQVRGVADDALAPLQDMLSQAGLLDPSPEGEAARNVLSSPLAGLDGSACFDIRPFAAALEDALVSDPAFHRLPAKFNWSVDGGGALGLDDVPSDIAFTATSVAGRPGFRVRLAGDGGGEAKAGADLVGAAAALTDAFLSLCARHDRAPHRMRDLARVAGAAAIFDQAGLPLCAGPTIRPSGSAIGLLPVEGSRVVGVAPAFGRLEAEALEGFARRAGQGGADALRLTPWRGLLAGGLLAEAATGLQGTAARLGFITDPADSRLAVAACAGAPACDRAGAAVQDQAAAWARLLRPSSSPDTLLHVSGCAKGCAHGAAAPVTLVARAGRYDLVRRGRAGDAPEAIGLSPEAVAALLARGIGTPAEAVA